MDHSLVACWMCSPQPMRGGGEVGAERHSWTRTGNGRSAVVRTSAVAERAEATKGGKEGDCLECPAFPAGLLAALLLGRGGCLWGRSGKQGAAALLGPAVAAAAAAFPAVVEGGDDAWA
eukprot:scaffold31650_cov23-Tisochrysis_lutea.AAC.1